MDIATALDFVAANKQGVLLTLRDNGRPQSSNIIHGVVDGEIWVSVTDSRSKTANLRRDPRADLHVSSDSFWQWVHIECDASLTPTAQAPDDDTVELLIDLYRQMSGEHDDWDDYRRAMVEDKRLILRLTPTRAYGQLPDAG